MSLKNKKILLTEILKRNYILVIIVISAIALRMHFLSRLGGDIFLPNLGGDPCHHFNLALNISLNKGPVTDFIFSYWFQHEKIPALSDIYPPGPHSYIALFLKFFGNSYFVARIAVLIAALTSIILAYKIGKLIFNTPIGLISASLIALNTSHIENSVIVMYPTITLAAMQLFVLFLLKIDKLKNSILSGIFLGITALCQNGAIILYPFSIILLWMLLPNDKNKIRSLFLFTLAFSLTIFPWALVTFNYFGSPFYSHMKYFSFTHNWINMMSDSKPPSIGDFIKNEFNLSYIQNFSKQLLLNALRGIKFLSPSIFFYLSPLLPFAVFLAIKKAKGAQKIILITFIMMALSIFVPFIIAISTGEGRLFARHYIIFFSILSPIFASGIYIIYKHLENKFHLFNFISQKKMIIFSAPIIVMLTIINNEIKSSPWNKNNNELYKIGNEIKNLTLENSVIMYAFTPQDAWCLTSRKIISDPIFGFYDKPSNRAQTEAVRYNAKYLLVDRDDEIYPRSNIYFDESLYSGLKLKKIYKAEKKNIVLYEIENN